MTMELAAVWINPYTIEKSRTGGVIARLLSLCPHELVAARVFCPSRELVEKYSRLIADKGSAESRMVREQIRNYLLEHWVQRKGARNKARVISLLFKGDNAIDTLRNRVVGPIKRKSILGETVRDTYGDYIKDSQGRVRYFEPAVLIIPEAEEAEKTLRLWARYSDQDGGVMSTACHFSGPVPPEMTLVLIKPESFRGPSSRPGNVIDVLSRAGLRIIGAKVVRMSINQAREFYRPVAQALVEKLKPRVVDQLKPILRDKFDFEIPDRVFDCIGDKLKSVYAESEFNKIIITMTGLDPRKVTELRERNRPGPEKCLALVYQGPGAVAKIRSVLGATDPTKAGWATIRRIYGYSIMENIAHASDSPRNTAREIKVLNIADNQFKSVINEFYRNK